MSVRAPAAFLLLLSACLPYRSEKRAFEVWTILDPAGKPRTNLEVRVDVVEGNCMALSNAQTGRIIEQIRLVTDAAGKIRTEREGVWRINPCIFRTDQGICVRHCYSIDHPGYAPLGTCEDEESVNAASGTITLRASRHPRWSEAMRKSYRESCRSVPYLQKRTRDIERYCDCLERRLDGSLPEERFMRMTDREVEAMLPTLDAPCR